jgi:transcription antitermination factor NusG
MLYVATASAAEIAQHCATAEHPWYAVRVKPNFEKTAAASLAARGFGQFVPTYTEKRRWSDRMKISEFPLFPGYLFCRMDPGCRTPVLATPGVIGIVSCGAQLLPVSEEEVEAVRRAAGLVPLVRWPFLASGDRVRVVRGSLAGLEGFVVDHRGECRLVLQISLLQRSVSLEIDRDAIEPVGSAALASA